MYLGLSLNESHIWSIKNIKKRNLCTEKFSIFFYIITSFALIVKSHQFVFYVEIIKLLDFTQEAKLMAF